MASIWSVVDTTWSTDPNLSIVFLIFDRYSLMLREFFLMFCSWIFNCEVCSSLSGKVDVQLDSDLWGWFTPHHSGQHSFGHGWQEPRHQQLILLLPLEIFCVHISWDFTISRKMSRRSWRFFKEVKKVVSSNCSHYLLLPQKIVLIVQLYRQNILEYCWRDFGGGCDGRSHGRVT